MIIKDKPESSSFLQTGQDYAQIAAGPYSVTSVNGAGTFINGPLSISSPIENIKVSGIYRFNPILATGIASTMITPVPVLTLDLPLKNISTMASIAAIAASLV